jgi:hypothetical protein
MQNKRTAGCFCRNSRETKYFFRRRKVPIHTGILSTDQHDSTSYGQ